MLKSTRQQCAARGAGIERMRIAAYFCRKNRKDLRRTEIFETAAYGVNVALKLRRVFSAALLERIARKRVLKPAVDPLITVFIEDTCSEILARGTVTIGSCYF